MSLSSGENETAEKMMKAPRKDGYIVRKDFENNPRKYFEELHKYKKLISMNMYVESIF